MAGVAQTTQERTRKARKRADGDGTISQHTTSGLWRGRLMVGRKPDGKPDIREVYAKSQGECRKKNDALKHRVAGGLVSDVRVERNTVGAYLERWLAGKRGTIEDTAWERHRHNV